MWLPRHLAAKISLFCCCCGHGLINHWSLESFRQPYPWRSYYRQRDCAGFSDPFCIVSMNNKKVFTTSVKKKTLFPKWNELVTVEMKQEASQLTIVSSCWLIGQRRMCTFKANVFSVLPRLLVPVSCHAGTSFSHRDNVWLIRVGWVLHEELLWVVGQGCQCKSWSCQQGFPFNWLPR